MITVEKQRKYNIAVIVLFILLMLPFMGLTGIKNAMDPNIYKIWQGSALVLMSLFIVFKFGSMRPNWATTLFFLYEVAVVYSSISHNGLNFGILAVSIIATLLFVILQSKYYREVIMAISIIIVLAVIINFPMMFTELDDKAELFIGGKNALSVFLIPGAFFLLLNSFEKNGRLTKVTIALLALCFATIIMGKSGTGIVVSIFAIAILLFSIKIKPKKFLYLAIILSLYAMFLIFAEYFFNTDIWLEIVQMLGKDSSLTSRTTIWRIVTDMIKENWLFGVGRGVEFGYTTPWGTEIVHTEAHNSILEILMCSGVVGFALYGTLLLMAVKKLDMSITKHKVIFVAICVLLINGLTESIVNNFLVITILGIVCRYANEEKESAVQNS